MFLAALTSRSCTVPHAPHCHSRTASGLGPSRAPHAEQTWLVGSNRPIFLNSRRALATLACPRATRTRALPVFALPFCLRDRTFCARFSFFSARRRNLGAAIFVPSSMTAK